MRKFQTVTNRKIGAGAALPVHIISVPTEAIEAGASTPMVLVTASHPGGVQSAANAIFVVQTVGNDVSAGAAIPVFSL